VNDNLGKHVRSYFEWLVAERNASPNTIHAYRDTMMLFMRYLADNTGKRIDRLKIDGNMHDHVLRFLHHLESKRKVAITTRNHRLSTLKSFFLFIAYREPLAAEHCRRVTLIPPKRHTTRLLEYLEPAEMEALLGAVDTKTKTGVRNYAMLLVLYNTGCRASEVCGLSISDVNLDSPAHVEVIGKGRRRRIVPLWKRTVVVLKNMIKYRRDNDPALFIGQRGEALSRAGVRYIVRKYAKLAAKSVPSLDLKKISPHTIRHTTAVALLRATGDIDSTAKILGHSSLNTTKIYTDRDKSRLAETINRVSVSLLGENVDNWKPTEDLLMWLEAL